MWTLDAAADVPVWRSSPRGLEVRLAFSTRRGGVSPPPYDSLNLGRSTSDDSDFVARNRRILLHAIGLDPRNLATAGQVHGDRIVEIDRPGHWPNCDALMTRRPGLALAVSSADCLPILFHAPGVVAAAHAGWRGIASHLPRKVVEAIRATRRSEAREIRAHLGPCIRVCCYEVGPDVARRFPGEAVRTIGDKLHLDIAMAARLQLEAAGIPMSALRDTAACTACQPTWYYSHRRDSGLTGRHWGVAAMQTSSSRKTSMTHSSG